HVMLCRVEAVGGSVTGWQHGDLVTNTVRRPDWCEACRSGQSDFCTDLEYTEFGIIGRHGFMTEYIVDQPERLIRVPVELEHVGILIEPLSVVEKALQQAQLIQRRISTWTPKSALVVGAGPSGLLGALLLRGRGVEDGTGVARRPAPNAPSRIIEAAGARYASVRERSLREIVADQPPVDVIFECSGNAEIAFDAMRVLGNNGVMVLLSITGGDDLVPQPINLLNREFVLGNKVLAGSVNSSKEHFELGVADLTAIVQRWRGLAEQLITRRLPGFAAWEQITQKESDGIKTVIEVG
ncbi:MAG: alcohol dehydrogenase catalytic domain-containing protein, partial [Chloroflexota bacterium]